jgi:hypothetical protein
MITAARRQVSPLARARKGVLDPLVDYLCEGGSEQVLETVADIPKAADAMKLNCVKPPWERRSHLESGRKRFFELAGKEAPVLLYRFAKIAEAVAGKNLSPIWESLPGELRWFDVLLNEALEICSWRSRNPLDWDVPLLQSILAAAGQPAELLPTLVLTVEDDTSSAREAVLAMPGMATALSQNRRAVGQALLQESAQGKVHALTELGRLKMRLDPYMDSLALLALDRAKSVREAAKKQLARVNKKDLRQTIERLASKGSAAQRQQAVRVLGERFGIDVHDFLRSLLEAEGSQKVREEIEQILKSAPAAKETQQAPPSLPSKPVICELIAEALAQAVKASDAAAQKARRRARGHRKSIPKAIEFLRQGGQLKRFARILQPEAPNDPTWQPYRDLVAEQDLSLVGIWRLLHMLGCTDLQSHRISPAGHMLLLTYRRSHAPELDLQLLATGAKAARLSARFIAAMYLPPGRCTATNPLELEPEAVWPFFSDNLRYLEETLKQAQDKEDCWALAERHQHTYQLLAMFPKIPDAIAPIIWDLALGSTKLDRAGARACLPHCPNKTARIMAALESDKKEVRAAAADWLADLGHAESAGAIQSVLKNETSDIPKAAMISALERFGLPVEAYLSRQRLVDEAKASVKRADREIIGWFPVDQLPAMHWEADQQPVAPEILHGFVVRACKLKSIAPSPLTRRYCAQMAERSAFGAFVLRAWIAEDTKRRYTPEEAAAAADRDAIWYSKVYNDPKEVENYRQRCYEKYLHECAGGASASRGVLSIVACCADSGILPAIANYLETYHGGRKSQCRFLLALLAHLDQPQATRLLLDIAAGIRIKALQKEATRVAAELASRKGWTRDELADRSIPTCGFDENGVQTIDYGSRQFQARLSAKFAVVLTDADGERIQNLPGAGKDEDADSVKAARKAFFDSTRELKHLRRTQQARLYEAMCTRRAWRFEDWDRDLNRHPIVGRHCARLVWMSGSTCFRSLEDRSLANIVGAAVAIAPDQTVMLAHSSVLKAADCAAWRQHLDDKEIRGLFDQFRESTFELAEDQRQATEISDFRGHMISSSTLHRVLTRLNYGRGQTGHSYHKHFPSLQLQAVIEFAGKCEPKADSATALLTLYFENDSQANSRLALGCLPSLLLGECWADLKLAAEAGTGYDEEWETKAR